MATSEDQRDLTTRLRERVVGRLALGLMSPGEQLPSARELAKEYDADPRAILAAFRNLEQDNLVELRSRSGVYVASGRAPQLDQRANWLRGVLREALTHDISVNELSAFIVAGTETLNIRVAMIDCNEDELWAAAQELQRDYGLETSTHLLTDVSAPGRYPQKIRQANVIVSTSAHAEAVGRIAQLNGASYLPLVLDQDLFAELRRLLLHADVHFVVADQRYALKVQYLLSDREDGLGNFCTYVVGQDDLASIPSDAAIYISPLARFRLSGQDSPDRQLLERTQPVGRSFAEGSSLGILALITRANLSAVNASAGAVGDSALHESDAIVVN